MKRTLLTAMLVCLWPFPSVLHEVARAAEAPHQTQAESRWSPPERPVYLQVFKGAAMDAREGRYQSALDRLIWIYESLSGPAPEREVAVRYWALLARGYPPAREAFDTHRSRAIDQLSRNENLVEAFRALTYFDEARGDMSEVVRQFEQFHRDDPKLAQALFPSAYSSLMHEERYELCGRYIQIERAYSEVLANYRGTAGVASQGSRERNFSTSIAGLVALLAVNGRLDEAREIAERSEEELPSDSNRALLEAALEGHMPK